MPPPFRTRDSYVNVLYRVLYDYAPYLNKRGANVWVEEVNAQRFIIGFTCWIDADRGRLWEWLHERLAGDTSERIYREIVVKDRSGWQPSRGP